MVCNTPQILSHSCQFIVRGHNAASVNKSIVPIEVVRLRIPVENNEMICPTYHILNVMLTRRSKLEFFDGQDWGEGGRGRKRSECLCRPVQPFQSKAYCCQLVNLWDSIKL